MDSKFTEACKLLDAKTPLELSRRYTKEDQKLIKSGVWDYENSELIINQIKDLLLIVDSSSLNEEEACWRNEILWFWYHHAISCAIHKKDKTAAQFFAETALLIQDNNHPNMITKLLYLLVHDDVEEAEKWITSIREEPEKTTACELLEDYRKKGFF